MSVLDVILDEKGKIKELIKKWNQEFSDIE